jgi:hypothetical protein
MKSKFRDGNWSPMKGTLFAVGILLILGGLIVAARSYWIYSQYAQFQPSTEQFDESLEAIDGMSAPELLETWKFVKEVGLDLEGGSPFVRAREMANEELLLVYAGLIAATIGLFAALGPVLVSGGQKGGPRGT